ncbi:MAG: DUF5722 domain-containing protein [Saonia sp.]
MNQKLFFQLLFLTLTSILGTSIYAQNITLELNPDLRNQMDITEDPVGTYDILTLAGGDPWIVTRPVSQSYDPDQVYVISFDYIAENGLDDLQIFYGTPFDPARKIEFGSLAQATTYTPFKAFMKYEVTNWTGIYDRFRLDIGRLAGQQIKIRNLQLRAASPEEVIEIDLDLTGKNQMDISETSPGIYNITTLPGGDPWVLSQQLTTTYDPDKTFVISFDYVATNGLDDLEIFYGAPISAARNAIFGSLEASTVPKNFTALMKISAPIWDASYDLFRFDIGRLAGQNIQISNLILREPTNEEKKAFEIKESVPIELDIARTSNNLDAIEVAPGSYELNTFGNDPWILSKPLTDIYDVNDSYVVSFEYKTEEAYNELELFYGPPISAAQRLSVGTLPQATDWTTFTFNPRLFVDNFQDMNWSLFRFDFGRNENVEKSISIRNLVIRKPTSEELEAEQNSDKFLSRAINESFLNYLNTSFTDSISKVKVTEEFVRIEGKVANTSEALFIAEIEPHQYGFDQTEFNVVVPLVIEEDSFSLEVNRFVEKSDHNYDRLYSRWAVVTKTGDSTYAFTSNAQWAGDISAIATSNIEEDKASTIKGLDGLTPTTLSNVPDLIDLDIKSMKINILLNGVFSLNPTTLAHEFNGKTYYMNPNFVAGFDQGIKAMTENGIKTAFVLLIPINIGNEDVKRIFVHPDASLGIYSMANVATEEGTEHYAAVIDFLAQRYSRPDKLYGRLDQWIIHNEVDAHTNWTHAGQKPVSLYTQIYDRSMRMVHYTIRKYNPTAKVFSSFTKHWNSKAGSEANFRSKDILGVLNSLSKKENDYEWGVGWHSYPTNLFNPKVWNDPPEKTQFNFNTPEITPKNLEMIDAYVRQKDILYNGKKVRTILLSENGFSSNTDRNPNANETTQAAALAYFWKKTDKRLPSIENIQLHRWVDNANEGGLEFGLWTVLDGTFDGFDQKKEGWFVWDAAGTPQEDAVFDPYKSVIGITDWNEIYEDVSTEVTPYTVRVQIQNCDADLNDLLVSFNGELKIPQEDGSLVFYNVASNVSQPYSVYKGNISLASDVLTVSEDMELNIELNAIDNISAEGISPTEIEIVWESVLGQTDGFVIEFKEAEGEFQVLAELGPNELNYVHSGLIPGDEYSYRVAALLGEDGQSCFSDQIDILAPFIIVDFKNGDTDKPLNNSIKPQLKLRNEADHPVALERITLRYWFTAEDFSPLNFYSDYAAVGTDKVMGNFTVLEEAREGANYYLEISFDTDQEIGALTNSGEIKTRIAKNDWTDFDETDDHSYATFNDYLETDKITVYWDNELIWGKEPKIAEEQTVKLIVLHKNRDQESNNTIKPNFILVNEGNQPVDLKDVTFKYWFSPETPAPLNYAFDYVKLGAANVTGTFGATENGTSSYFEVGFDQAAGALYAYSNSGEIKSRLWKQDWSSFNELDDHSYQAIGTVFSPNSMITAYIDGQLVWGQEPGTSNSNNLLNSQGPTSFKVFPNPVYNTATLEWPETIQTIDNIVLIDYMNITYPVNASVQGNQVIIQPGSLTPGLYIIKGRINGKPISHRVIIQ